MVQVNEAIKREDMLSIMCTELMLHTKVLRPREIEKQETENKPLQGSLPDDGEGPPAEDDGGLALEYSYEI